MTAKPERDDEDWDGVVERAGPDWPGLALAAAPLAAYVGAMVLGVFFMPGDMKFAGAALLVLVFGAADAYACDAHGRWAMRSTMVPWVAGIVLVGVMLILRPSPGWAGAALTLLVVAALLMTLLLTLRLEGRRLTVLKIGAANTAVAALVAYFGTMLVAAV